MIRITDKISNAFFCGSYNELMLMQTSVALTLGCTCQPDVADTEMHMSADGADTGMHMSASCASIITNFVKFS